MEEANTNLQSEIEERRRAVDLKDEFVSTVSHELRTPLAITNEGISLLLDEIPGQMNEKQKKILTTIRDNMDRLTRIINDLLDISKIEAGKMDIKKTRVNIAKLASVVLGPMVPVAEKKGITLVSDIAEGLVDAHADMDRIIQALTNLVGNALKFTDAGSVTVRAVQDGDMVVCRVEDTGFGLAPEESSVIFQKFVQVGRKHGAGIKGTGLGLAISRQIVVLHHGKIWVESEKGKGSTFFFSLPVYNENNVIAEIIAGVIQEAREAQEGFILLLFEIVCGESDDAAFRRGFERLLESQEHVRASDLVIPRRENQVILLANVRPDQIGLLYRRWESQVSACYMDSGALDVSLRCGYAQYPEDSATSELLLDKALSTLSDMGRMKIENNV